VGITAKDGRAAGVELADGRVVEADLVVAGAPVPALYERRIVPGARGDAVPGRQAVTPPGRFTVCLALRGGRPADAAHRTVVHAPDRGAELAAVFGAGG